MKIVWEKKLKMIPLRTTRLMLTWLGMFQDENLASWQKFASALLSLICFILIAIQIASSVIFVTEFLFIDLERSLMAISQVLVFSPVLYMLLVTLVLRSKITALIEEITMIFNSGMDSFYVLICSLLSVSLCALS